MCTFLHSELQERTKPPLFLHSWLGNVLRATAACTFGHLNFQKWSDVGVLCTFWLENVLRATTACTFSSLIWPDGFAPLFFSEHTFWPSGAPNHWKTTVNRDFPTFSRTCIFFLLTLSLLWFSNFLASPLWLFPPLVFHRSILSEVWLLNFLR